MDNDNKDDNKPKLAEVKQFKKREVVKEEEVVITFQEALRTLADNVEKGMLGQLNDFAIVVDSVDYGITLMGSSTDRAKMALILQAGLQVNIEDYLYGGVEEDS